MTSWLNVALGCIQRPSATTTALGTAAATIAVTETVASNCCQVNVRVRPSTNIANAAVADRLTPSAVRLANTSGSGSARATKSCSVAIRSARETTTSKNARVIQLDCDPRLTKSINTTGTYPATSNARHTTLSTPSDNTSTSDAMVAGLFTPTKADHQSPATNRSDHGACNTTLATTATPSEVTSHADARHGVGVNGAAISNTAIRATTIGNTTGLNVNATATTNNSDATSCERRPPVGRTEVSRSVFASSRAKPAIRRAKSKIHGANAHKMIASRRPSRAAKMPTGNAA